MRSTLTLASLLVASAVTQAQTPAASTAAAVQPADPYIWLEEVQGDQALAWVRQRNAESLAVLQKRPEYEPARAKVLEILNSKDKIPYIQRIGDHVYNLWTDEKNQRGLWRRTTLDDYKKPQPTWETVIDVDALGAAENQSWVWVGADCLGPAYERCLVTLSPGGSDAAVIREFDLRKKEWVKDGFQLPEAKSSITWIDANTVWVGTDFGPGSLTKSGYVRVIKEWKRGSPLSAAKTLFEAKEDDVSAYSFRTRDAGFERSFVGRAIDFYNTEMFWVQAGQQIKIDKPSDAQFEPSGPWAFLSLRSDWKIGRKTYRAGSLLVARFDEYISGKRDFEVLFAPTASTSLQSYALTRRHVLIDVLDNVKSRIVEWTYANGKWTSRKVRTPENGTMGIASLADSSLAQDPLGDHYLITYKDFLTPDSLMLATAGRDERTTLKALPERFDASGMRVQQYFARSKDGTRVPYFVVYPKNPKPEGNPTLLYGYGGFQVSEQPWYSGSWGSNWTSRGGVFVLANIRGGGEFGPTWHRAAQLANKQRSYDDFIAIAQDLIARRITTPKQLGIMGGSNGGLLVGASFTQRPDLFGAVVCQVPLLDMRRYHLLLAGASWMAEYGNPDKPEDWAFIRRYSPYHNVKAGVKYPRVFFNTSTKDDRVHPAHARKMVARMQELGHDVLYFENIEGGHGGAADNTQRAHLMALEFAYLWMMLQ